MAIISASYDQEGPLPEPEYKHGFGPGLVWGRYQKDNQVLRRSWAIDATGGETVALTIVVGADTYLLRSADIARGYAKQSGVLTAVYWLPDTSWTWLG